MKSDFETERLEELCSYEVLDTGIEEGFERITRMARSIFDVPIALISLVDEERQWFKSRQGLNAAETPRNVSFCTHAIETDRPFVVDDALKDKRFCHNPLVTGEPYIRFYAGAPLRSPREFNLGTLCLVDTKARAMTIEQLDLLCDLAAMVMSELELRKLSTTDPLTGALSRIEFRRVLDAQVATAKATSMPLSLIMVSIDRMSWMNSTHGYDAGNCVLKEVAAACGSMFQSPAIVARYSGKQFVIILPNTDQKQATKLAQDLKAEVAEIPIFQGRKSSEVTASIGIAEFSRRRDTSKTLLARASSRVAAAKRSGRNQIVFSDVLTTTGDAA